MAEVTKMPPAEMLRDVDEHHRLFFIRVAVHIRVVQGGQRAVHLAGGKVVGDDFVIKGIQIFRLDGYKDGFPFQALGGEEVVVPHHFIQREGDVLLGFKADELFHIGIVQGRKLDEADENGLPGNGIVGNAAFDIEFLDEVGDCLPYFRQAQAFRRRVQHYEARSIAVQDKGVFGGLGKDAH